jgi:glucose/arabinose dehydrogenase
MRSLASRLGRRVLGACAPLGWMLALALGTASAPRAALADIQLPTDFEDQLIIGELDRPYGLAFLPDGRLLIAERTGRVRMVVDGKLGVVDPMLTVDSLLIVSEQEGLLGIAIDSQWPSRPYVYTLSTCLDSTIRISRFRANGDLDSGSSVNLGLDPASRFEVMRDIPNRDKSQNGGTIRFGPDGYLYASLGDDNYRCGAQDTSTLRGELIRIRVDSLPDGPGGVTDKNVLVPPSNPFTWHKYVNARLLWSMGLRNPFRFHIDSGGLGIFIGDGGFFQYEEISQATTPAQNFGWPYYEGTAPAYGACFNGIPNNLVDPIVVYDRSALPAAMVVSAGVYRVTACGTCSFPPSYDGDYFFSDFYAGFLRRLHFSGGSWSYAPIVPGQPSDVDWGEGFNEVTDYLEGPDGALWYCRTAYGGQPYSGEIHRIVHNSGGTTGVASGAAPVAEFSPPFPSPALGRARFAYSLARPARAQLVLYDVLGRSVRHLVEPSRQSAGRHETMWDGTLDDGRAAAPGIYRARLIVDGTVFERSVALLR